MGQKSFLYEGRNSTVSATGENVFSRVSGYRTVPEVIHESNDDDDGDEVKVRQLIF